MFVFKGYVYGFVILILNVNFFYKCDNYYNVEVDGGIVFDDLDLVIDWLIDLLRVIMLEKDYCYLILKEFEVENLFVYGEI